jgi:hypothetical protein
LKEYKGKINKKVLIIAGSPDAISRKRDLSHYDLIIKMNRTPLDNKYDDCISQRCDIWSVAPELPPIMKTNKKYCEIANEIWVYNYTNKQHKYFEKLKKSGFCKTKIKIMPNEEIRKFCANNKFVDIPSTGLATIITAMFFYSDVTILGFTHQLGSNKAHFYDNQTRRVHNFEKEKVIINLLISQGLLKKHN